MSAKSFTERQGQYLAFIDAYTRVHGRPPAETDMQRHFQLSPPSVHQMVLTLERLGHIRRQPGVARSIEVLLAPEDLPVLRHPQPAVSGAKDAPFGAALPASLCRQKRASQGPTRRYPRHLGEALWANARLRRKRRAVWRRFARQSLPTETRFPVRDRRRAPCVQRFTRSIGSWVLRVAYGGSDLMNWTWAR